MSPMRTYRMIRRDEKDPLKGLDMTSIKAKRNAKVASLGPIWKRGIRSNSTMAMYGTNDDSGVVLRYSHENEGGYSVSLNAMKTKAFEEV